MMKNEIKKTEYVSNILLDLATTGPKLDLTG